jgi:Family of unknown function (DUF6687)
MSVNHGLRPMTFVPYADAARVPNIIVDGAAAPGTVLTLSHWPRSGTPAKLRADTSAEIVFNYLDTPSLHVDVDAASNNHFDEDGLIGLFTLIEPIIASRWRDRLVDAATAGDFGVYRSRDAARVAFVLGAYADQATSPLPSTTFAGSYAEVAANLYREMLPIVPQLLTHIEDYRHLWEADDRELSASEAALDAHVVAIESHDDLDLAIVRVPDGAAVPHPTALHTRTPHSRLIVVSGGLVELRYRYEGWVQFASRAIAPRVDLTPLADELSTDEQQGRWVFEGVDAITPRLYFDGAATALAPDHVVSRMEHALRTGAAAWNPYDAPR